MSGKLVVYIYNYYMKHQIEHSTREANTRVEYYRTSVETYSDYGIYDKTNKRLTTMNVEVLKRIQSKMQVSTLLVHTVHTGLPAYPVYAPPTKHITEKPPGKYSHSLGTEKHSLH